MIFKKPKLTYTEMCIYIDKHAYEPDCDDNLIYEYLYHIIYMLARKSGYFNAEHYYNDFAIQSASKIFMRYKNPKQYIIDDATGEPKLTKIISVLNYIKSKLYPMKVEFEQSNYSQTYNYNEDDLSEPIEYMFVKKLSTDDAMHKLEFTDYLNRIVIIIRKELKKIPYVNNKVAWRNIYISCLLTILNSITLSNKNKEKLYIKNNYMYTKESYVEKVFREESSDPVLLYHLDQTMKPYIFVLTNKVKRVLANDLSSMIKSWEPPSEMIKNMLFTVYEENSSGEDR
jgi:hypothetical protein